jgi:hypothetical protein
MSDPSIHKPPNGSPRIHGTIVGAVVGLVLFIIVLSLSDLELGVGRATLYPIHIVFGSAVIILFAYLFSRRRRSKSPDECKPRSPEPPPSSNKMASLALVAFVGGPILGLAIGLLGVAVSNVDPMDRRPVVLAITVLGFVVGTVVAVALALAGNLK